MNCVLSHPMLGVFMLPVLVLSHPCCGCVFCCMVADGLGLLPNHLVICFLSGRRPSVAEPLMHITCQFVVGAVHLLASWFQYDWTLLERSVKMCGLVLGPAGHN